MKKFASKYKTAGLCAAVGLIGLIVAPLNPGGLNLTVFFGLLAIAETAYQTRVWWRRYKRFLAGQKINQPRDLKIGSISR